MDRDEIGQGLCPGIPELFCGGGDGVGKGYWNEGLGVVGVVQTLYLQDQQGDILVHNFFYRKKSYLIFHAKTISTF